MKKRILTLLMLVTGSVNANISGLMKVQASYGTTQHVWQQQEVQLDIEYEDSLAQGEMVIIGRVLTDNQDYLQHSLNIAPESYGKGNGPAIISRDAQVTLREFYWQYSAQNSFWRIGKQQVVWGESDGIKLLDVINPQSYREFILDDFDDSRIPLWMVNGEIVTSENSMLQLLFIPDSSVHELAASGSIYQLTSPQLVPVVPVGSDINLIEAVAPSFSLSNADVGAKWSTFVAGWDFSVNYLYHFVDTPVFIASSHFSATDVQGQYKRSHLLGGTASSAVGDWIVRAELAYETDRFIRSSVSIPGAESSHQFSTVIGLDWQGWTDQFVSFQWFQSYITDHKQTMLMDKMEQRFSLLWESNFLNETLSFKYLQLHSLNHGDGVIRPKLSYNLESNIDVHIGADIFYGQGDEFFGQFSETDRITLGIDIGF